MHVLSFGEGRKFVFLFSAFSDFRHQRLVYGLLPVVCFFECLVIMDILCAFEESNAPNCLDGDSITCVFDVWQPLSATHRTVSYSPQMRLMGIKPLLFLVLGIWSWDWLLA